jgi:hypothetical protein
VAILNLMEKLKLIDGAFEKKGAARGFYCLRDNGLVELIQSQVARDQMNDIIHKVVSRIKASSIKTDERTLILTELYRNLPDSREGLEITKNGAEILKRSGQKAKAATYYDHVLQCLAKCILTPSEAELFVDAVIGKTAIMTHRTPVPEQIPVLMRAEKIAEE